jgi:hypothetical protein
MVHFPRSMVSFLASVTKRSQCCGGNADKSNCATKVSNYQAKECSTERRANAREHSDKALRQIESAGSVREISNN